VLGSGASCREIADLRLVVIARSEATEAIHSSILRRQPWIASRSLSSGGHSRGPLARNGIGAKIVSVTKSFSAAA
jgi:hypothetical protein